MLIIGWALITAFLTLGINILLTLLNIPPFNMVTHLIIIGISAVCSAFVIDSVSG